MNENWVSTNRMHAIYVLFKAMNDIGVVMTPFGDIVAIKSNRMSSPENYHVRLESGEFLILGHEKVPQRFQAFLIPDFARS